MMLLWVKSNKSVEGRHVATCGRHAVRGRRGAVGAACWLACTSNLVHIFILG